MKITRTTLGMLLICLLTPAAVAIAQENPLSANNKFIYGAVRSEEHTSELQSR